MVFIQSPYDLSDAILAPATDTTRIAIVSLRLYAGSRFYDFELQRGNGSSGAFNTIAIIPKGSFSIWRKRYTFNDTDLPSGTNFFRYRGRHVRADAIPSAWSTRVIAISQVVDLSAGAQIASMDDDTYDPDSSILQLRDYTDFGGDGEFGL
jgi:hypothetical protein